MQVSAPLVCSQTITEKTDDEMMMDFVHFKEHNQLTHCRRWEILICTQSARNTVCMGKEVWIQS